MTWLDTVLLIVAGVLAGAPAMLIVLRGARAESDRLYEVAQLEAQVKRLDDLLTEKRQEAAALRLEVSRLEGKIKDSHAANRNMWRWVQEARGQGYSPYKQQATEVQCER